MRRKWIPVTVAVALAVVAIGAVALRLRHHEPAPARAAGAISLPVDSGFATLTGTIRAQHVVTFGAHCGRRGASAGSAPRRGERTEAPGYRLPAGVRYRQRRRRPASQHGPVGNARGGRL